MEKLMIYSKSMFEGSNPIKKFAEKNFSNIISKNNFLLFGSFLNMKNKIPYFLTEVNSEHHKDVKNIEKTRRIKGVKKENLSLIVFDSHTDMYQKGEEKYPYIEKRITMANWLTYMLSLKYSNIALVGVTDFTKSAPQRKGFEYDSLDNKVSFFLGPKYNPQIDFKDYNGEIKLHSIDEFFNLPLKENSFISFDSDVSSDFTSMNQNFAGRLGGLTIEKSKEIIKHIKENSNLIGFSFYGTFWDNSFREESSNLLSLLNE